MSENIRNTYRGEVSAMPACEVNMQSLVNSILAEEDLTPEQVQWLSTAESSLEISKEEIHTEDSPLPQTLFDHEGVLHEIDTSLGGLEPWKEGLGLSRTGSSLDLESQFNCGRVGDEINANGSLDQWERGVGLWKEDMNTNYNLQLVPENQLNWGGGTDGMNTDGSLHQWEEALGLSKEDMQTDSNLVPENQFYWGGINTEEPQHGHEFSDQGTGSEWTGEGTSLEGGEDGELKRIPKKNSEQSFQRHSRTAVMIMRKFYEGETAYPNDRQLYKLSRTTGLTVKQVNSWFSNEREKKRKDPSSAGVIYKTKNNHPHDSINVLRAWVDTHMENERPTTEEKMQLAEESNLSLLKVSYWFENFRKRQRKLIRKAN